MTPPVNYERYIHEEEFAPLSQYINATPVMSKNIVLVGEKLGRKYHILTEKAKHLIRTLLEALYLFHREEKCPGHFTKSNLFVTRSGGVKLRGVDFHNKEDSMVFQNYQDARTIILETVFQQYKKHIPEDVTHLLRLMNSRAAVTDMEYVICTHASLLPLGNREAFFLKIYKHIVFVLRYDQPNAQKSILGALPYDINWYNKLAGNRLLEELFRWKKCERKKGITAFLDSYRNAIVHDMDDYHKREKYNSKDLQLILLVTYPLLLPRMQEELEKKKQLRDLELGTLFGSNFET